jgi:hypothetical protein
VLTLALVVSAVATCGPAAGAAEPGGGGSLAAYADVRPRPLAPIKPGTVVGKGPTAGWSHLVLLARSRLGTGDVDAVPRSAARYSGIFQLVVLANVRDANAADPGAQPSFYLEKVGIGGAIDIAGKAIVATSQQTFGKDLGFIGRRVFQESENMVASDIRQVARTRTMVVFDGSAFVLYNHKHRRMVVRYAVVVAPRDGRLATFVWLLGSDGKGGYTRAEPTLQLLPAGMHEDRVLSVDGSKFTLGIPAIDAFALARIPQGTPVRFSEALATYGVVRRFDAEHALKLEAELQARYMPLLDTTGPTKTAGR